MERHNGLVIALSNLITGFVVLLAAVVAGPWFQEEEKPKTKPSGTIEQPRNPGVGERTEFTGEVHDLPRGYAIWAFVRDVNGGQFYPKYSACGVQGDEWDCGSLRVGTEGTLDKESDLKAVLVSAEGVAQIMEYVIDVEYREVRNEGMKALPAGSTVLDSLRVTRVR
ncbi:hypothetical protein [Streptomyces hawaiiensis]|uniref:hypothetical protein n=1 Tax=Streptomyces hawaiiensis TaxID=67305 RepID=UPI0036537A9F